MCWYTSAKECCEMFQSPYAYASANYCIGKDGEIWLCVDEANRAWTSGSSYNDNRAITIECANYTTTRNGHVNGQLPNKTWNSLIKLCADICKRNGIERLNYTGDDSGNLTMHKWYSDTDCPGPWLSLQFGRLANEVNNMLKNNPVKYTVDSNFGGLYKCTVSNLNIRDYPSLNGNIIQDCQYHMNDVVMLDNWYAKRDGYIWGRYIGETSGCYRYVAVGKATGKIEPDDYLIKII